MRSVLPLAAFLLAAATGVFYSQGPLRLSYRGMGEMVVFMLFGPIPVMGGYYLQTGIFPSLKALLLSLPLGFLTTAILFTNEVPDRRTDMASGKRHWAAMIDPGKAYLLYAAIVACAFLSVPANIYAGNLSLFSITSLALILPAWRAGRILKRYHGDKPKLVRSSRLVVLTHALLGIILVLDRLLPAFS
jgi:1,4-dihydroxy-2-naphthoate octaprenyltransferase